MLRFPRRIAARFGALVRADPSGVRAGFGALLISSGGDLVAGLTLASINHTLLELPALFVLIPAAIGMRGNVFGALGSRLGTLIHTGEGDLLVTQINISYALQYEDMTYQFQSLFSWNLLLNHRSLCG